jgi:putative hydrolase of the HAD superfamily
VGDITPATRKDCEESMKITTIVFDFGNVLGFFSHRRAAEQLAAYGTVAAEAIQAHLFGGDLEDEYESGRISSAALIDRFRQRFALRGTDEELIRAYADMFWPNEEVCALPPLLRRNHRLLLLSNTTELHSRQFVPQFQGALVHFHHLVLSHEVGIRKPDPRIYAHCQGLAGSAAAECLFIDDLSTNVEAARACGWHGIVYERGMDLRAALARHGIYCGEK